MKVIQIGTDNKIFEEDSNARKRMLEYGKLFEELHIIVFSNNKLQNTNIKIGESVWVYSTNSKNKLFYIWDAFKIARKILTTSVSRLATVVSCQDPFETGVVGLLLKLSFGVPLQLQIHTDFKNRYFVLHSLLNTIRFILGHITIPFADTIRCVSEKIYLGIKDMNDDVIVLPISRVSNNSNFEYQKEFKGRLLTICRLEKEKNLEIAIRVFAKVLGKYPEAVFTIVGDGRERGVLENLARTLAISDNMRFVGWQNDTAEFYKNADIYVSTSLFEGYGMSMVEAGSYGLPLVLSNTGIAEEYFEKNGALIFEPKDSETLYKHLTSLFSDPKLREDLSLKAPVSVSKHLLNWNDYLLSYKKSLENIYKKQNNNGLVIRFSCFVLTVFNRNKILRFLVAGGSIAISQILLLFLLTDFGGLWYLFSSITSYVYAVVASFLLQKYWVFRDKNKDRAISQFFQFILVAILGMFINTSSMYFWVEIIGLWYILSQFITGIIIAIINFFVYKFVIFRK